MTDEARLDALRAEAAATGRVAGVGATIVGGPIPLPGAALSGETPPPGYWGRPVIKPPVWTWEIPLYFFVGGMAGMAGVIALAATLTHLDAVLEGTGPVAALVRGALWLAVTGAVVSPILLILDLGRPARFLNMLRVFKWRSPMSVGAWTLACFGGVALPTALVMETLQRGSTLGLPVSAAELLAGAALLATAVTGAVLATYTGVLLGATAVPAWFAHRRELPLHFGVASLGSAAAALELAGHRLPALDGLGFAAAGVETLLALWFAIRQHGDADRSARTGRAAVLLRLASFCTGPAALGLRFADAIPAAAGVFLLGALLSRYGWLAAGRASALDPTATFAAQRP